MPGRKEYRGGAGELTLGTAMTAGSTSFTVTGDVTNWPAGGTNPFVVDIDSDLGSAEKLLIQQRSGSVFTVVAVTGRGYDGTSAQSHAIGALVRHVLDADTLDDANRHVNDDTSDDHSQYLNTTRHDLAARHSVGTVIPAAAPGASAPGDTASAGASSSVARADHRHSRTDSYGAVGSMSAEAIGDTASAGSSANVARIDHRHAMPGTGTPSTQAIGDAAAAGSGPTVSYSDHKHAMPAFATPSGALTFGGANAAGSAATLPRADHVHALPAVLGLSLNEDKNDGDTGTISGGTSTTVATKAITTTGARMFCIEAYVVVRATTDDAFAGYVHIKMNGSTLTGGTRRFGTHLATGDATSLFYPCSFQVWTSQSAGSYTFTMVVENDVGAINVLASQRCLSVNVIGG